MKFMVMENKRKRGSFSEDLQSDAKLNRMEAEENVKSSHQTKIVDIDNDCLECVFEFLEFRDLINLAEANKFLQVAAKIVFGRKLKRKMVVVEIQKSCVTSDIENYDDAIRIRDSMLAVQTIRHFGQRISKIVLIIKTDSSLREKFFAHANEYCHKTLNILHIFGDHSNVFGAVKHPFEFVEEFWTEKGTIGPGCEHFTKLFPRLRHLMFKDNDILDWNYICETFPNLYTFALNNQYKWLPNFFHEDEFERITTLNPHLQSFQLDTYFNPGIWLLIKEQLKNLNSIHALFSPEHCNSFERKPILFNDVAKFVVIGTPSYYTDKPTEVFTFKCLKNCKVICFEDEIDMWLDFVLANPTINNLDFQLRDFLYLDDFKKLRKKWDKVCENTKFISISLTKYSVRIFQLWEFWKYFEAFSKVDKLSVVIRLSEMEIFSKQFKIIQKKNPQYKITKKIRMHTSLHIQVDFDKCE